MHLFDADLLALQNHLGKGEPLEVSIPTPILSRTVSKDTAGCLGPCPVGIWIPPRIEVPHPVWATWSSAWPLSSCRFFFLNLVEISLVARSIAFCLIPMHLQKVCLLYNHPLLIYAAVVYRAAWIGWWRETDTLNSCQAEVNKIRTCWAKASAGQGRGTAGLSN